MWFFSSRRRHTRCSRDWSSDVCSSDLPDTDMTEIGRAATEAIEELGLKPQVHEDVKAVTASRGSGGVLFNGHLDTVPLASGWTREQGAWDGDFLYGRGTADMKAGCVA